MKLKSSLFIFILIIMILTLTGCNAKDSSKLEYVGMDMAKEAAMAAAGLSKDQIASANVEMSTKDGLDYYFVEFESDGEIYTFYVDAVTGTVIRENEEPSTGGTGRPGSALGGGGGNVNADTPVLPPQTEDENLVTDADTYGPADEVPGATDTPVITDPGTDTPPAATPTQITADQAKAAALSHAGLTAGQVTFVECVLDWEDGRYMAYDIEFYTADHTEFDYEIDAFTGAVLDFDRDAEHYTPPAAQTQPEPSTGTGIGADKAKSIALAQVPGATAADIREFEVDYDDGRLEYEGTIIYGSMEYEFEIDGYSGAIRSWDVESIYD